MDKKADVEKNTATANVAGDKGEAQEEKKFTLTGPQLVQLSQQERQRLEQISMRISALQGMRNELHGAKDSLEEISKAGKGNRIMVPLGAGIFVEANLEEDSKAIAGITGSVFREKNNEALVKILERRIEGVDKELAAMGQEQQKAMARVNQLDALMQAGARFMQEQAAKSQQQKQ